MKTKTALDRPQRCQEGSLYHSKYTKYNKKLEKALFRALTFVKPFLITYTFL